MGMCSLRKRSAKGRSRESDEDGGDDPREDEEDGSETMPGGAMSLRHHAPSKLSKSSQYDEQSKKIRLLPNDCVHQILIYRRRLLHRMVKYRTSKSRREWKLDKISSIQKQSFQPKSWFANINKLYVSRVFKGVYLHAADP